jgi:hypothetical protein
MLLELLESSALINLLRNKLLINDETKEATVLCRAVAPVLRIVGVAHGRGTVLYGSLWNPMEPWQEHSRDR